MGKFGVGQTAGYVYLDIKYALQQMILNSY